MLRSFLKVLWQLPPWILLLVVAVPAFLWSINSPITRTDLQNIGDYYFDAHPALMEMIYHNPLGAYGVDPLPLMTPFSLIIRAALLAPLAWAGLLDLESLPAVDTHWTATSISYVLGSLLLFVGCGALMLWRVRSSLVGAVQPQWMPVALSVVLLFFLLNSITAGALSWGHPEEILLAVTSMIAFLSLITHQYRWAVVFLALAVMTKQPAVFFVPLMFFAIPSQYRLKCSLVFLGICGLIAAPYLLPYLGEVISQQLKAGTGDGSVGAAPFKTNVFDLFGVTDTLGGLSRPLIALIAVGLPLALLKGNWREQIPLRQVMAAAAIIALARCWFDPYNIIYYAAPWALLMVVMEIEQWRRGAHFLQRRWPQLPIPIPLATVILVWMYGTVTMGSWLTNLGNEAFGGGTTLTALVVIPAFGWMILCLVSEQPVIRLQVLLPAVAAYVALVGFISIVPSFRPADSSATVNEDTINLGSGFELAPAENLALEAAPEKIYQLSSESTELGLPARFTARSTGEDVFRNGVARNKSTTFFDYGPPDEGLRGVSLFTFLPGNFTQHRKVFHQCQQDDCPLDSRIETGKFGDMLVTQAGAEDPWEAKVFIGDQMVYVLILDPVAFPPEEVLGLIQPVPLSSKDKS